MCRSEAFLNPNSFFLTTMHYEIVINHITRVIAIKFIYNINYMNIKNYSYTIINSIHIKHYYPHLRKIFKDRFHVFVISSIISFIVMHYFIWNIYIWREILRLVHLQNVCTNLLLWFMTVMNYYWNVYRTFSRQYNISICCILQNMQQRSPWNSCYQHNFLCAFDN